MSLPWAVSAFIVNATNAQKDATNDMRDLGSHKGTHVVF